LDLPQDHEETYDIEVGILQRAGFDVRSIRRPATGFSGTIRQCLLGETQCYFRMMSRNEMITQVHIAAQMKEVGIPVPDLIASGYDQITDKGFTVQSVVPGQPVLHIDNRRHLVMESARQLRRVHDIELSGFGVLTKTESGLAGKHESWKEVVQRLLPTWTIRELKELALVTPGQEKWIGDLVHGLSKSGQERSVLLHGDFHLDHVFSDGNRITGILDWARVLAGDSNFDLAVTSYFLGDEFDVFMRGYGGETDPGRIEEYRLIIALRKVHWAHKYFPDILSEKLTMFDQYWHTFSRLRTN
jgi:aminoglycoside phosphotransferase (APT) family kinase protein